MVTPPNLTFVEDPACGAKGRDYSVPLLTKEGLGEVSLLTPDFNVEVVLLRIQLYGQPHGCFHSFRGLIRSSESLNPFDFPVRVPG